MKILHEINQFECFYDLDELHFSEFDFNLEDKLLIYFYSLESCISLFIISMNLIKGKEIELFVFIKN